MIYINIKPCYNYFSQSHRAGKQKHSVYRLFILYKKGDYIRPIIHDGQVYNDGDTPWDLGSFQLVGVDGNKRHYSGKSADAPAKLPKYDDLATDSTAKCTDNGDFYYYDALDKEWRLQ